MSTTVEKKKVKKTIAQHQAGSNGHRRRGGMLTRPPKVLKPLIEEQIELGYRAGEAFFTKAGSLLLEARKQIRATRAWGQYVASLHVNGAPVSDKQATDWMRLGRSHQLGLGHTTVSQARRDPRTAGRAAGRSYQGPEHTHGSVQDDDEEEAPTTQQDRVEMTRQRREERAEMLLLIKWGYRRLATKRHPDKGGSNAAMDLLGRAREILMTYATRWS